jgi:GNAT superfamily N-acetyltransferase
MQLIFMDNDSTIPAARIELLPVASADYEDFLIQLYASTRDDIEFLALDAAQKKSLLEMQYLAQKQHYAEQYPEASHDIILLDNQPVGRIIVKRSAEELLGVDLALLPEYRNLGIGTFLLKNLLNEAAQTNRIFCFHVVKTNPAVRLYIRLGCFVTEDTGMHFKMQGPPPE